MRNIYTNFSFIVIVFNVFLIVNNLYAQNITQNIQFDQITNESGRSLGFITGIEQDSTGFIWFASRNGLSRYDGYSFTYFRKSKRTQYSLPFNDITFSYYDRNKMLWLRHFDKLYLFENQKISNRFDTILQNRFSHNTQVVQDIENNYWIGPHEQQLYKFNPQRMAVDTFICQTNQINPRIIELLRQNSGKALKLTPNINKTDLDTSITFTIEADGHYIVSTAGEGNRFNLFDYGTVKKGSKIIWTPQYSKCNTSRESLYYSQLDMLFLSRGTYQLTYKNDDANTFDSTALAQNMPEYGITLTPMPNYTEAEKILNEPYTQQNGIFGTIIYQLAVNQSGYPLISTDKAIQEYNPETKRFQIIETVNVPTDIRNYITIPVLETPDNKYVYVVQNRVFLKNRDEVQQVNLQSVDMAICIMSDFENNLWVGTTNGLFFIDLCNSNLQHGVVHMNSTIENRLYSDKIWNIFEDHSHNIWIGTDKGLNRYRKSKFNVINIDNERFTTQPMATDNHGNIFLLTQQGEWTVIKNNKVEQLELPKSIFKYEQQTGEYIYDFNDLIIVDNETCFFATGNKIGKMDKAGNLLKINQVANLQFGNENSVISLLPTDEGLWAATIEKMIFFDNNLNIINEVNHPKIHENSYDINKGFVKDVIWIGKSSLAVRTELEIYSLSTNDLKIKTLYEIPEFNIGTTSSEGNLALDSDSCLWFVVFPQLVSISKNGQLFETTIDISEDIGNGKIIFIDSTMLICSNNGLLKIPNYRSILDLKTDTLTDKYYDFYTTQDGLVDNLITGIVADKQNNIWLTTYKGLSFMDLRTEEIQNYFRDGDFISLGFPGNKIARSDKQSNIAILQTTDGIMTFVPDSINPFVPNVVINELLLFGKDIETDSMLWDKKFLKLKYNQNFLTIGFSALDFTQPTQNKYRYRMENLNDEWIYTDANNRRAIFTGIPPGVYKFTVQGSNNDGLWNTEGQSIIIEITPPWWRTTVAYITYIVIAIAAIFTYIKIRERKLVEEKRILEEKVTERTHEIMMQKEEIQKQSDKIAMQHKEITDSIHYASRIQTALLPSEEHMQNILPSHFVLWLPRDIVSGDFFWITNDNDLTIAVAADCTGHGVPGAFMSMLGISFLNELVNKERLSETNEILNRLRTNIIDSLKQTGEQGGSKDGMDISMCAINHSTLTARFSGAYNPLVIIRNDEILEYKADKMPIGYHIKKDEMFSYQDIQLQIGDRLYMYSDGYVDQFGGEDGRKFMSKRFKEMLLETRDLSMQEQKTHLIKTLEEWMGNHEQIDDILVFGIEITGKQLAINNEQLRITNN